MEGGFKAHCRHLSIVSTESTCPLNEAAEYPVKLLIGQKFMNALCPLSTWCDITMPCWKLHSALFDVSFLKCQPTMKQISPLNIKGCVQWVLSDTKQLSECYFITYARYFGDTFLWNRTFSYITAASESLLSNGLDFGDPRKIQALSLYISISNFR